MIIIKQAVVIFEGMDKTGKTTLKEEFNKRTNFIHYVVDRGPISNIAYNNLFNREKELNDFFEKLCDSIKNVNHLIVYCYANENDIKERLKKHNEELPENTTIYETQELFFNEIKNRQLNFIAINTSFSTIDECLYDIINAIKYCS